MFRQISCFLLAGLLLAGCKPADDDPSGAAVAGQGPDSPGELSIEGNYVGPGYQQRAEGYDWVAVMVSAAEEGRYTVRVRSRADRKKPTCTFDATLSPLSGSTYITSAQGAEILFRFSSGDLTISAADPAGEDILFYFCSGGGSLAGTYARIPGEIDTAQLEPAFGP